MQFAFVAPLPGAEVPLDKMGEPFYSKTLQVKWDVATNPLPARAAIFKVVSPAFSQHAISNLIQMARFSESNRVPSSELHGRWSAEGNILFRSPDQSRSLFISPSEGKVHLYSPDFSATLEGVPTQARAYELGTNIIAALGLPTKELQSDQNGHPRAWFYPGTRTHFDKGQRKMITEPSSMGVEFRRVLDGLPSDQQSLNIQFEGGERITQLKLRWQGAQVAKQCSVASPDQIMDWIKEGRARVQSRETTGTRWVKVSEIKQLTIKDIELCYSAGTSIDKDGDERPADYLYPYAVLEAEAQISADDAESFCLFSPVIAEGLSKPSHDAGEFGVFPSALNEKHAKERQPGEQ